jgi:hypothetical protein
MASITMTEPQYAARGDPWLGERAGPRYRVTSPDDIDRPRFDPDGSHWDRSRCNPEHPKVLGPRLAGATSTNRGLRGTATAAQNYISCLKQYVAWDAASGLSFDTWQLPGLVIYSATDQVHGLVRVVLQDSNKGIYGRVMWWDREPLRQSNARLVSAVAVEVLDNAYGPTRVQAVDTWQSETATSVGSPPRPHEPVVRPRQRLSPCSDRRTVPFHEAQRRCAVALNWLAVV